jgi:hypothetical protein
MKLPIAIMAFDRPAYLESVLQTVISQAGYGDFEPIFFFFQDGAISPRTGIPAGSPEKIAASISIFEKYFPEATLLPSETNLGVAMNFDRAERILFEEYEFDAAIFLEDDLILQPHYMTTMAALIEVALECAHIGMVSACGYLMSTPLAVQRARARELCLMDEHNWAFGITRRAWLARDRVLRPYLDLVSDIDYRTRSTRNPQLKAYQRSLGRGGRGYLTSQDSMKNLALEALGIHRVSTFANNARYIGKVGEHSTEEKFSAKKYDQTILYDAPQTQFDVPSSEELSLRRAGLYLR